MLRLPLKKPIVIDGNKHDQAEKITISELCFREEVCAGDLRDMPLGALVAPATMPLGQVLKLAGRLAGQPDAVINLLGMADTQEVAAAVVGFLMAGQETGTEASQ